MGREVYHGDPKGDLSEVQKYDQGVREGAFGLLLNSVRTQRCPSVVLLLFEICHFFIQITIRIFQLDRK